MAAVSNSTQSALAAFRGTLSAAPAVKASKNVKAKAHKGLALVLLG